MASVPSGPCPSSVTLRLGNPVKLLEAEPTPGGLGALSGNKELM